MTDTLDLDELKREMAMSPKGPWIIGRKILPPLIAEVERLRAENRTLRNYAVSALDEQERIRRLVGNPIEGISFPVRP